MEILVALLSMLEIKLKFLGFITPVGLQYGKNPWCCTAFVSIAMMFEKVDVYAAICNRAPIVVICFVGHKICRISIQYICTKKKITMLFSQPAKTCSKSAK